MKYDNRFPGKFSASINLFTLLCGKYVKKKRVTVSVKENWKAEFHLTYGPDIDGKKVGAHEWGAWNVHKQ